MGTPEPRKAQLFALAGPPTSGPAGTLADTAAVGDVLSDTRSGALWRCVERKEATGFTGPGQDHLAGEVASITWEKL